MLEQVNVMSAEQYFNKYAVEGIGKGADRWMVRRQLIDAFHKEIFGLVAMRAKKEFKDIPPEGDLEATRIARNVIKDATKKWRKLCDMFANYQQTCNLLKYDDLKMEEEEYGGELQDQNDGGDAVQDSDDSGQSGGTDNGAEETGEIARGDSDTPKAADETIGEEEILTSGYVAVVEEGTN